jgi:hypothetical protein
MDVVTLKYIMLALLMLCVIWLVKIVVKKETENLVRTVLLSIVFLAAFLYLQYQKTEKITFAYVKAQVKETFFPERPLHYVYYKEESRGGTKTYVRYTFESPGPKLYVYLDRDQKYFYFKDVYALNRVLEYVGLPKVQKPVPELVSITGSRNDLNLYRWDNYPLGILTVERQICQNRDALESYQCIQSIMITGR